MLNSRFAPQLHPLALKLIALALSVAVVGLPINDPAVYALLVGLAVVIFSGTVRAEGRAWLAAVAIVTVAIAGQFLLAPPRIDEGHNVFLPGRALEAALPTEVMLFRPMEFFLNRQCRGR
jgi:hypothetical protein